jgi:hypothetical protein
MIKWWNKQKLSILILPILLIGTFGAIGIGYACYSGGPVIANSTGFYFSWAASNDDGTSTTPAGFSLPVDPGDNGNDPNTAQSAELPCRRFGGNYAVTLANLNSAQDVITLSLQNVYPGYLSTLFFGLKNANNTAALMETISIVSSSELSVALNGIETSVSLPPDSQTIGTLSIGLPSSAGNETQDKTFWVKVSFNLEEDISIATSSLPDAEVGVHYQNSDDRFALTASGGSPPYKWLVVSGSLPPGMRLNYGTGVISGKPIETGTFSFTVKMTDRYGSSTVKSFSITVYPAVYITTDSLADGRTGQYYSQTLEASGGLPPYTWEIRSGRLPYGISLDPISGVISGQPTIAGTFKSKVRVSDPLGGFEDKFLTIKVIGNSHGNGHGW